MEQVTQADKNAALHVNCLHWLFADGEPNALLLDILARHRIEATQAKDEEIARLRSVLKQADDAIREMFRYFDGGETRGSYDGRPERNQLRLAGDATRRALENHHA